MKQINPVDQERIILLSFERTRVLETVLKLRVERNYRPELVVLMSIGKGL